MNIHGASVQICANEDKTEWWAAHNGKQISGAFYKTEFDLLFMLDLYFDKNRC